MVQEQCLMSIDGRTGVRRRTVSWRHEQPQLYSSDVSNLLDGTSSSSLAAAKMLEGGSMQLSDSSLSSRLIKKIQWFVVLSPQFIVSPVGGDESFERVIESFTSLKSAWNAIALSVFKMYIIGLYHHCLFVYLFPNFKLKRCIDRLLSRWSTLFEWVTSRFHAS